MNPGLIIILAFLLAMVVFAARAGARKKHRVTPDPDKPEAANAPGTNTKRPRPSYGAARSRTRKPPE